METTTATRPQQAARTGPAVLALICTGYFMVILDATVTNVALPSIGRGLHGSVTGLQWVVDAYTLSFAAFLLTGGALAERFGGRRLFAGGLVVFGAASAACGLAPTLGVLVAARLVQGIGAAVLVPSSLLLLQAAFADPGARARALGLWGAIAGVGAASGPIVGGVLVTAWSWRGAFLLNLPFAIVALLAAPRLAPVTSPRPRAVDLGGQVLAVAGLGTLTAALVSAGRLGWAAPAVLGGCAASATAAAGSGMALTMPAATSAVLESAPADRGGIASGVVNAARQAGGVLGVAVLGSLVSGPAAFIGGLRAGLAVAGGAFLAGAAVVAAGGLARG